MKKRCGCSYEKRVADINRIYDQYSHTGLPNREIWKRYVYPLFGISERTFYNIMKAPCKPVMKMAEEGFLFPDVFNDDIRNPDYFRKNP